MIAVAIPLTPAAQANDAPDETDPGAEQKNLSDIVVTARRKEERLQDTPIAVSAVSGEDIEQRSMRTLQDLTTSTPSLNLIPANNSQTNYYFALRGFAVPDVSLTLEPSVAVYQDGVSLPHGLGADAADFLDIQRVEVLKGPQGTLFGRSTTGGAVSFFTNTPTRELGGMVSARIGNYEDWSLSGVLNAPVSDSIAVRIAGLYRTTDGYGVNVATGARLGATERGLVRATASWEPSDKVSIILRGDYARARTSMGATRLTYINPVGAAAANVATATGTSLADAVASMWNSRPEDFQDGNYNLAPAGTDRSYGLSLTAKLEINDNLSLQWISAFRGLNQVRSVDIDGTPYEILEFPDQIIRAKQYSQEIQINNESGRLSGVSGIFLAFEDGYSILNQTALTSINPEALSIYENNVDNTSYAIFTQQTYAILDNLNLTGGVRYSIDERGVRSRNRTNLSCLALGQPLGVGNCSRSLSARFKQFSYTINLDYHVTPDVMLYAKTDRGYRTGGFPQTGGSALTPASATFSWGPVRPEIVHNYELGIKGDWFDRRLRVNVGYYYSKYTDLQRNITGVVPGTQNLIARLTNAGKATIQGVEAEAEAKPFPGFELRATAAWADGKYGADVVPPTGVPFVAFAGLPEWTYSLSGAYEQPTSVGTVRAQLDYFWMDSFYASGPSTAVSVDAARIAARGLLNGRISVSIDGGWDVAAFSRNLTNKKYYSFITDTTPVGFISAVVGPPRTFGMEIKKRF